MKTKEEIEKESLTLQNKDYQPDYSVTNLDVITYRNGDAIPKVENSKEWSELTTGAYCYYDNDSSKGILYNWYAVNDLRGLAPEGWKIPNDKEMNLLDLKINSQFNGYRNDLGNFNDIGAGGDWWSSSEFNTNAAWYRDLNSNNGAVYRDLNSKQNGFSVRCLRDNVKTIKEDDLKDWDVTLNDGLENEVWNEKLIQDLINETVPEPFATPEELQEKPYISDDFQIGPDGAYEHTEEDMLEAIIYGSSLTPSHAKLYANNYINSLNKKWTKEEAEQNKNNLLKELNELPISKDNLDWVTKELDQLIDEGVRQTKL